MNFLKITGLVIGTGSVVGGAGAGIYYANNKKNFKKENSEIIENKKDQFTSKLVFEKKTGTGNETNYEMKFLSETEYNNEETKFNNDASEGEKYKDINKIVDILHSTNIEDIKNKLNSIFETQANFGEIKSKILIKEKELKELFNDEIYKNLKNKFWDSNV